MYGTDDGIYLSNLGERNREPVKVLALNDVQQVDVLEDYQLLIVLSGKQHGKHRKRTILADAFQSDKSSHSRWTPWIQGTPWPA